MAERYLIKFSPETGDRLATYPCDKDMTAEKETSMIADGFEVVSEEIFQKLIGNYDGKYYIKNINGEGFIPKETPKPSLKKAKEYKLQELKEARDLNEVKPIISNGHLYDYDDKARDRVNAAIIALDLAGNDATIEWTMADNTSATITAMDLRTMIAAVAMRSNQLHVRYRQLKELVEAATTYDDVIAISWNTTVE